MARSTRDLIYRLFIISHIAPSILLALPQIIPDSLLPSWSKLPLQWYLTTYHDPLGGGKSFPGGWFGGMTVCEVLLQLPYFLWALTVPVGKNLGCIIDPLGHPRLELPSLAYSIHASTAAFAAVCELFSFPESILTQSDKITLGAMYIPFQLVMGIMAIDMYKRLRRRLQTIKHE